MLESFKCGFLQLFFIDLGLCLGFCSPSRKGFCCLRLFVQSYNDYVPDTWFSTGCPVVNKIDTMQNFRAHGLVVAKENSASKHTSPFAVTVGGH